MMRLSLIGPLLLVLALGVGLTNRAEADAIAAAVTPPAIAVSKDDAGITKFSGENIQFLARSGEPALPFQVLRLLLPPDADPGSVNASSTVLRTPFGDGMVYEYRHAFKLD